MKLAKFLFLTGFNGSQPELEENMIHYLSGEGIEVEQIDYYRYYKVPNTRELVMGITNDIIRKYYENGCEPLNLIGWSLGGTILTEVLNNISILNEQVDGINQAIDSIGNVNAKRKRPTNLEIEKAQKIEIGKVILFSPAWYIIDVKNYLKSHIDPNFYASEEAKNINDGSEKHAFPYIVKKPLAPYHLLRLSQFSHNPTSYINDNGQEFDTNVDGLSVLGKYPTTLIVPENDAYVNVEKTLAAAKKSGISEENIHVIGNYGHLAPVVKGAVDEVLKRLRK